MTLKLGACHSGVDYESFYFPQYIKCSRWPPPLFQSSFIPSISIAYKICSIMVRTTLRLSRTVDSSAHIHLPWPQGCCNFIYRLRRQHYHLGNRRRHHGDRPRHHDGTSSSTNRASSYGYACLHVYTTHCIHADTRIFQVVVSIWDMFVDILCCRCFTPRWRRGGRRWRRTGIAAPL